MAYAVCLPRVTVLLLVVLLTLGRLHAWTVIHTMLEKGLCLDH